jgi:phosphate transport system permease protein
VSTAPTAPAPTKRSFRRRTGARTTSLFAHGEPQVWIAGGALAICVFMIVGILALVVWQGAGTFWPRRIVALGLHDGRAVLGEVVDQETYEPDPALVSRLDERTRAWLAAHGGRSARRLLRTENFEFTGTHYTWIADFDVASESEPEWAVVVERRAGGPLYGEPIAFVRDGARVASEPSAVWTLLEEELPAARERAATADDIRRDDIGHVNHRIEEGRLAVRRAELEHGAESATARAESARVDGRAAELAAELERLRGEIDALERKNARSALVVRTLDGHEVELTLGSVVRAVPANRLGTWGRIATYADRAWEFVSANPRESNTEGGVLPAIFGTVCMTLVMSLCVVPFGVLAALYLREYAKPGPLVSIVRIAVNNLAGVPSIVFGVFGLGFFCYLLGASIDELFYAERSPSPTFGTGGLLWASATLALLTLPVVIVPTEEALAAVPSSMREGSYACGATKWQTIWRIVLPRALPGILTGMILAVARGAGEVAPLMLVGAVKVADLPVDGEAPFVHPSRSFMHLGFHIYDLGFQSPNSEAAKPMVYTTTLLLIGIVVLLNVVAIVARAKLRRRFQGAQV